MGQSASRNMRFALVPLPRSEAIPAQFEEALCVRGVPRSLLGQPIACAEATVLVNDHAGEVIRFAARGLFEHICLDPVTGEVVTLVGFDPEKPQVNGCSWREFPPNFVNSSYELFLASVEAVTARWPFYSRTREDEDDTPDRVADEIVEIITRIDPPAMAPDTFWDTFRWDVAIGDWATEDVEGLEA